MFMFCTKMDIQQISNLAAQIRSSNETKTNVFTLSTTALTCLLKSFDSTEVQSTSFNTKTNPQFKAELIRDLQFLQNFFQQTKSLKLYEDGSDDDLDITKFKNLLSAEFVRVNVNKVKGLQVLRSQLQKIVCHKTLNALEEVLSNCGADKSQPYCWNELKEATFVNNNIEELDRSLECAPWLHTVDLSHNEIKNIEVLSCLPNLKYLNLSYNRLEDVQQLRGQICSRLQHLVLKNNFIEDITGLRSLTNLRVLDLSNNCLLDHRHLSSLSHLATLQWLGLRHNPLAYHPHHRSRTASYLHLNTASHPFVLDRLPLSAHERRQVGGFFPLQAKQAANWATDSMCSASDRGRRVREVVIEEAGPASVHAPKLSASPQRHLETKRQIEDLHERFGESWLNSQSGLLVQEVLGLEGSCKQLSSSPYDRDFTIYSGEFDRNVPVKGEAVEIDDNVVEEYERGEEAVEEDVEADVEGEESIYLAKVGEETIFLVLTTTHFSERECSAGNERIKWHVDSIIDCQILEDSKSVKIDFETMRKDRKQRIYIFEEELEAFVACIKNKINCRKPKANDVKYQCMKCSTVFQYVKNESILGESAVKCPNCDSTLVVEDV